MTVLPCRSRMDLERFELSTSRLQGGRSSNWSYRPVGMVGGLLPGRVDRVTDRMPPTPSPHVISTADFTYPPSYDNPFALRLHARRSAKMRQTRIRVPHIRNSRAPRHGWLAEDSSRRRAETSCVLRRHTVCIVGGRPDGTSTAASTWTWVRDRISARSASMNDAP